MVSCSRTLFMEILFLSSLHLSAFSRICFARSSGADEQIVYGIEIAAAGSFMRQRGLPWIGKKAWKNKLEMLVICFLCFSIVFCLSNMHNFQETAREEVRIRNNVHSEKRLCWCCCLKLRVRSQKSLFVATTNWSQTRSFSSNCSKTVKEVVAPAMTLSRNEQFKATILNTWNLKGFSKMAKSSFSL